MNVISDDDIIDQTEYEEFAGVAKPLTFEEEPEDIEDVTLPAHADISPNWQLASEHTFVQEHFCKITSCEYCGKVIASLRWHQGLRCRECSFDCHYDCAPLAPKNCLSLHDEAPLRPDTLQPHAFYEKHLGGSTFCNVCRKMLYGLACQFVAHEECLPKAPINCPPQRLDAPLSEPLRHYWVEGNLSGHCRRCRQSLSKFTILYGFRCSYCALKLCPTCFPQSQHESCDEGSMASLKLGPGHIITHATDVPKKWTISVPEDRRPLIVFINKRSGGQVGQLIAQRLSRLVNPNQIIDLSQGGPMPMLKIMQKTKAPYRILACGGDGTAAWLLSALDKMLERGATYIPPVAVLPLGTGNDLARVLGWGGGYDNEGLGPICHKIILGHEVYLDRWRLDIENVGVPDGEKPPKIMNNYFSIGLDANIALEFHRKREANPSQFKSRNINKVIYAGLGATKMFESVPNLRRELRVDLDGVQLTLPKDLVCIMAVNLASYSGGTNPWGSPGRSEGRAPQSPCDGLFELIGITTPFHLGSIQTHLVDGTRLGQGRDVTFTWLGNDKTLPVQLDGEPWEEPPSIIRLSFFRQSRMIASPSEHEYWAKSQWLEPLPFTEPIKRKSKKSHTDTAPQTTSVASSSSKHTNIDASQLVIELEPSSSSLKDKKPKKPKKKNTTQPDSNTSDSISSVTELVDTTKRGDLIDFIDIDTSSDALHASSPDLLILDDQIAPPRRNRKIRPETEPEAPLSTAISLEPEPEPLHTKPTELNATELVSLNVPI